VNDEDVWELEQFHLLVGTYVILASTAVPSVLLRENLGLAEVAEAISQFDGFVSLGSVRVTTFFSFSGNGGFVLGSLHGTREIVSKSLILSFLRRIHVELTTNSELGLSVPLANHLDFKRSVILRDLASQAVFLITTCSASEDLSVHVGNLVGAGSRGANGGRGAIFFAFLGLSSTSSGNGCLAPQ